MLLRNHLMFCQFRKSAESMRHRRLFVSAGLCYQFQPLIVAHAGLVLLLLKVRPRTHPIFSAVPRRGIVSTTDTEEEDDRDYGHRRKSVRGPCPSAERDNRRSDKEYQKGYVRLPLKLGAQLPARIVC